MYRTFYVPFSATRGEFFTKFAHTHEERAELNASWGFSLSFFVTRATGFNISRVVCPISANSSTEQFWNGYGFIFAQDARVSEYMLSPDTEKFANVVIAADESMSVVPLTLGSRRKRFDEVEFSKHI